ncbi:MAG TPA: glycoside hydrolase family 18 protein [Limnochordia bacterium]|nr:glycoside hydrolase family 18 protein [Limnochordia bacterium]
MLIVSYLRTWPLGSTEAEMAQGRRWSAQDIRGDLLDTINVAFALLDGTRLYLPALQDQPGLPAFSNLFEELAAVKARYPQVRINLSVGGWGAEGFSDLASSRASRAQFAAEAASWIGRYNLDGIDIDWEYPVGPPGGQEIKSRPEDGENYVRLLGDLRRELNTLSAKLGRPLTLTTAVPALAWFVQVVDVARVQEQVDYLKLMAYDFYGGWSATTGHAANLFSNPQDPAGWSGDQAVELYLKAGVQPGKLLLGVPFYARAWRGVEPKNNGLFQPFSSAAYAHGLSYNELKERFLTDPSYVRHWDDTAKAAYLYNGSEFISYEDAQSLGHKAAYARRRGLAGLMIWEYGHDLSGELLTALSKSLQEQNEL